MQIYNNPRGIRAAIAATLQIPIEQVELAYTGTGFRILRPTGASPDPATVAAWEPPVVEPEPVDPLDALAAALGSREEQAKQAITRLKATAAAALVQGGMSEAEAYAAGSALVVEHSARISAFKDAGGNAVAAQNLLDAIIAAPPVWWSEPMEQLFAAGLGLA